MSAAKDTDKMVVQLTASELRELILTTLEQHQRAANSGTSAPSRWIDATDAAKHFGCSSQTIRNWIKQGAPATQIGSSAHPVFRIDLVQFETWVRSQRKQSTK